MSQNDFMQSYLEGWVFLLSVVAMVAFIITFRGRLFARDLSATSMIVRAVLLAYALAIIVAFMTPRSRFGTSTPVWFPLTFRSLLGLSCVGLIVLTFQRDTTLHKRWISLLIALVVVGLIYTSIQHGNLTMNDWRMVGW
jgi:hypothetical protein